MAPVDTVKVERRIRGFRQVGGFFAWGIISRLATCMHLTVLSAQGLSGENALVVSPRTMKSLRFFNGQLVVAECLPPATDVSTSPLQDIFRVWLYAQVPDGLVRVQRDCESPGDDSASLFTTPGACLKLRKLWTVVSGSSSHLAQPRTCV